MGESPFRRTLVSKKHGFTHTCRAWLNHYYCQNRDFSTCLHTPSHMHAYTNDAEEHSDLFRSRPGESVPILYGCKQLPPLGAACACVWVWVCVCEYGNAVGPQSLLTVFGNTPHVSTPCCSSIQDISIPLLNNLLSSHPSILASVSAPSHSVLLRIFSFFKTNIKWAERRSGKWNANWFAQMWFERLFRKIPLTYSLSYKVLQLGTA